MGAMMLWMALFWVAVVAIAAVVAVAVTRDSRERSITVPAVVVAAGLAMGLLVAVPMFVIAAGGWDMDMWNMHGGGRNTANDRLVDANADVTVRIQDFAFEPGNLRIPAGAAVTWLNDDSAPHDATDRGGAWETARLSHGDSDTVVFDAPGAYDYYCTIHPSMKARLVVR